MIAQPTFTLMVNYVDRAAIGAKAAADGKWGWCIEIRNEFEPPDSWVGMPDYTSHDEAAAAGLAFVVDYYADPERSDEPVGSYQLTFLNPAIDVTVSESPEGWWTFRVDCVEDNLEGRYLARGTSTESYETRGQALGAGVYYGRWFIDRVGSPPSKIHVADETRPRRSDEVPLVG